ncbi:MAG: ATP-binding protein [Vicinamibacterales bacterium]
MVAGVVTALSLLHLMDLTRTLLAESQARAELIANAIYHQTREVVSSRETAYEELRSSASVRAALEAAIYSEDVTDAVIVDRAGAIIAANDRDRVGQTVAPRASLSALLAAGGLAQLRAVYSGGQTLEWAQPIKMGDQPFAEVRIGFSTILVRRDLNQSLRPAALAAGVALLVAVLLAMLLAQVVLRPIHVITSGLSRLGRGDLGATLDLRDEEFRDVGDMFDRVSAQLRAVGSGRLQPAQLVELSRRIAGIGRLTTGVTHEAKNPLNAMTIHLELLKEKLADPAAAAVHVDVIAKEIRRLDEVIQRFLQFVRPVELSLAPVVLAPLVAGVLEVVRPEAERAGVLIECRCTNGALSVEGDAALLRDALLNLAQNALQAMPGGGRLSIACGPAADGRVEIRVADTGAGIPPEHLALIFDLYFTTKTGGSGVGLPTVYRTVTVHNGDIGVESVEGRGTTFTMTLPALQSR